MIKSSDIPSPFKVFISTFVAQGPVYAFFINNKQILFFYLLSLSLFFLNSAVLAFLVVIIKKPFAPMFGSIDDEAYWKRGFADRRRVKRSRIIKMILIVILWATLAYFIVNKLVSIYLPSVQ